MNKINTVRVEGDGIWEILIASIKINDCDNNSHDVNVSKKVYVL